MFTKKVGHFNFVLMVKILELNPEPKFMKNQI